MIHPGLTGTIRLLGSGPGYPGPDYPNFTVAIGTVAVVVSILPLSEQKVCLLEVSGSMRGVAALGTTSSKSNPNHPTQTRPDISQSVVQRCQVMLQREADQLLLPTFWCLVVAVWTPVAVTHNPGSALHMPRLMQNPRPRAARAAKVVTQLVVCCEPQLRCGRARRQRVDRRVRSAGCGRSMETRPKLLIACLELGAGLHAPDSVPSRVGGHRRQFDALTISCTILRAHIQLLCEGK
jgi:hypothetical protein